MGKVPEQIQHSLQALTQSILAMDEELSELKLENEHLRELISSHEEEILNLNKNDDPYNEIFETSFQIAIELKELTLFSDFFPTLIEKLGKRAFVTFLSQMIRWLENKQYDSMVLFYSIFEGVKLPIDKEIDTLFTNLIEGIFEADYEEFEEMDLMFIQTLSRLRTLNMTSLAPVVLSYLKTEFPRHSKLVMETNSSEIILEYFTCLIAYNLHSELKQVFEQLLNEWAFFDSNVTKGEFYRFLWYSYYLNLDDQLIDHSVDSLAFIQESNDPEVLFYNLYYETMGEGSATSDATFNELKELAQRMHFLNTIEKETLLTGILINKRSKRPSLARPPVTNLPIIESIVQIKKTTTHCPDCSSFRLQPTLYRVKTYKKKQKEFIGEVTTELLKCSKCARVYGYDQHYQTAMHKAAPYLINRELHPKEYPPMNKENKVVKKVGGTLFVWPNTDANETTKPGQSEMTNFKEETDLHKLGYKITGLSRSQRWDILQRKALPSQCLKDIVYTIARNVRLRKSQAGGKTKYAYAIAEWEHDLKKLKQEYYKNNFTWPQY